MAIGKPSPPCSDSGGYSVQPPAGAPPGTNSVPSSSVKANGRIQNEKLLRRGSAMSGAPTCIGIIQFARPVQAGMTAPKIMTSACMVVMELKNCGSTNCRPGWNSSARMIIAIDAADEEHHAGEHQVHRADVLVIGRVDPAAPAVGRAVVVVIVVGVRRLRCVRVPCLTSRLKLTAGGRRRARRRRLRCRRARWPGATSASFCSACLARSQASNSAGDFTSTTMGMKPWSRPQSSAHWPRYMPVLSASTCTQISLT